MSLKGIKFICISKEKFDMLYPEKIVNKVRQDKFRNFINSHKDIFLWNEETEQGRRILEGIDTSSIKETTLKHMKEFCAFAFYKKYKGYYGLDVAWVEEWGIILINFNNSRVTIPALEILLDMANHCDAMLLVNGRKQITKEFIEAEKIGLKK